MMFTERVTQLTQHLEQGSVVRETNAWSRPVMIFDWSYPMPRQWSTFNGWSAHRLAQHIAEREIGFTPTIQLALIKEENRTNGV